MATFQEVILKALQNGQMKMLSVNQHMVELSKETKKKAGFVKTNATDELVSGLMDRTRVAFILHINAEELNRISWEIDQSNSKGDVENAS